MTSFDQDIPSMFRDFGVPVVCGSVNTTGLFDHVTKAEAFGQELADVLIMEPSVLVQADVLPAARNGTAITVDGTAYTIRDRRAMSDGKLIRFFLKAAA